MNRFRRKLHSRRGISILLALLLMLVAAMVSAVILSASVTAAKRVHDDRAQEQDFLSVSSGARFLLDTLSDADASYRIVTTEFIDSHGYPVRAPQSAATSGDAAISGLFAVAETRRTAAPYSVTVTPDGATAALCPVALTFALERDAESSSVTESGRYDLYTVTNGVVRAAGAGQETPQTQLFLTGQLKRQEHSEGPAVIDPADYGIEAAEGGEETYYIFTTTVTWTAQNLAVSSREAAE